MTTARNVHDFLPMGLKLLASAGIPMPSRAGNVLAYPIPVEIVYENPSERVLFWPERDANPFMHFFEALYFLAGRNDLGYMTHFLKRFEDYSDDGKILAGSYGYRWRKHWGWDQIDRIIRLLQDQPFTRRAVLCMWDPDVDLQEDETLNKDIPCNIQIMFRVMYGKRDEPNRLHMTVINRSNDLIWGLAGANAVHMSVLQEYVAAKLGLFVGYLRTYTNNLHAYEDVYRKTAVGNLNPSQIINLPSPYETGTVSPYPMVQNPATWDRDLALFMEAPEAYGYDNPFFAQVAKPLWFSHKAFKRRKYDEALEIVEQCQATDWKLAVTEWLQRRIARHVEAKS